MTDTLQGPDVASYQYYPDWRKVRDSGRSFAWTKATEGVGYVNPYFLQNWRAIQAVGLIRGAYHFGRPEQGNGKDQAKYFLDIVGGLVQYDLLGLDLEEGGGNLLSWALDFLQTIELELGYKPLLYSGRWFLDPHGIEGSDELAQYGLWLSGYTKDPPALPPGWLYLAMWQYTDMAVIPGIPGACDESVFFGDVSQLAKYGYMGDVQSPHVESPTALSQLVTIDSVIGDQTYPDGSDWDVIVPDQGISKRMFIRLLVQHAKTLPGLSDATVTRLSVMGDMTYPDNAKADDQAPNQPQGVSRRIFIRQLVQEDKKSVGA